MAVYWEIVAHSAFDIFFDIFSMYEYLIDNLDFPTSVFRLGISFLGSGGCNSTVSFPDSFSVHIFLFHFSAIFTGQSFA